MFIGQWQKRRKYYASNKYKILHTNSRLYETGLGAGATDCTTNWKTLTDATGKDKKCKGNGNGKKDKQCNDIDKDDVYVSPDALLKGKCLISI